MEKQELLRASQRSEDSFFSINSGTRSSQSISRRTFSRVKGAKSITVGGDSSVNKDSEFKEITNENFSDDFVEMDLIRVDSEFNSYADMLIEWYEKEY